MRRPMFDRNRWGKFGRMRTHLLASAVIVSSGVMAGAGWAQTIPPSAYAPTQGQVAAPLTSRSVATSNDNNNLQAAEKSGAFANPEPGTIVIHIDGRVHTGLKSTWSSVDQRLATAPAGSTGPTGVVKLEPNALYGYARLYFGADAMAANGLRYGAAIEIRGELHRPAQRQHQLQCERLLVSFDLVCTAAHSPTSPATIGKSFVPARPTASSACSTTA